MKNKHIHLLLSVAVATSLLKAEPVAVDSQIKQVELYPSGAAVIREVDVPASSENQVIIRLEGLPRNLMESSLQVAVDGEAGIRLGGFTYLPNETPVKEDDPRTEALRTQVQSLDREMATTRARIESIQARIQFSQSLANEVRGSLKESATADAFGLAQTAWKEFEAISKAGREEVAELNESLRELGIKRKDLQKDLDELVKDLNATTGVLQLDVSGELADGVTLLVGYQMRQAGWAPVHEIRANPAKGAIEWVVKARLHQNTGEDWTDVAVSLNSASALYAGQLPELRPLYLRRLEAHAYARGQSSADAVYELSPMEVRTEKAGYAAQAPAPEATTTGFFIPLADVVSVESGEPPVVREALRGVLKSEFWSECVPELSTDAWLMAGFTNDLGFPVLAGEAYNFIDGQLVARVHIEEIPVGEEVEQSLGTNENIVVERVERLKKESKGGLIDKTKRFDIKYETTVANRMPVAHRVVLQDRFPVGRDNKIQVKRVSPKDVEPEEGKGTFKWERTIDAGESASMITEYSVNYPAEWQVVPAL
jgi:uncharacterized protein (TIGR02231 family)